MASVQFGLGQFQMTSKATAGTTNLVTGIPTIFVRLTAGTGPITSFGSGANKWRIVYVDTAVTLSHSGAGTAGTIYLPTAANIAAVPGDWFMARSDASGAWSVQFYQRGDGSPLTAGTAVARYLTPGAWASRPAASGNTGKIYFATDIGVGPGAEFISDGTDWIPMHAITLHRSAVKISIPNNTLTTFQNYLTLPSLPAGLMGTKNALYAECYLSFTGSTNAKTMRFIFGGSTTAIQASTAAAANLSGRASVLIRNRGVANSQISQNVLALGGFAFANVVPNLGTVDTTAAASMVFSGQTTLAGEVLDLEWYEVRLIP